MHCSSPWSEEHVIGTTLVKDDRGPRVCCPRALILLLPAVIALSGCAGVLASADDNACERELQRVEHTAQAARTELSEGIIAEARQATLSRMVDAAGRARAACGYERPDTDSSRRARQPKAG